MTTKPPSSLAASGSGEETIDDSLDEILLEANERSLENPIRPSVPRLQLPQPGTPGPLAVAAATPLPLPGIAPPPEMIPTPAPLVTSPYDEVTQIARPSVLDEVGEDSTNVEPMETARLAAASKGAHANGHGANGGTNGDARHDGGMRDLEDEIASLALTDQASAERDRALRRMSTTAPVPPPPAFASSASEFEDPDDQDVEPDIEEESEESDGSGGHALIGAPLANARPSPEEDYGDTPGAISIEDDDDDESTANGRAPIAGLAAAASAAPLALPEPPSFGTRLPPPGMPTGRPDSMGHIRLPTPNPAYSIPAPGTPATGQPYSVPTPNRGFAPIPGASPFGNARASTPAILIPAPSGIPAPAAGGNILTKRVSLPRGVVVWIAAGACLLGIFVGKVILGGNAPASAPVAAVAPTEAPAPAPQAVAAQPAAAAAPSAPVVQPVKAPPPAPPPPPAAAAAAAEEPAAPAAEEQAAAEPAPPPPPRPAPRVIRRAPASASVSATPRAAKPKKGTDNRGVAKGWVDPFSQ